jgi:hypothetical protein
VGVREEGEDEDKDRKYGKSGKMRTRSIARIGRGRKRAYIENT